MRRPAIAAAVTALMLFASAPSRAAEPSSPGPICAPSVWMALSALDKGMGAAAVFGGQAAAAARAKGRELLLPLFGIDPDTLPPQPESGDIADDVARAIEGTRLDPERRMSLCVTITDAMQGVTGGATAGLDALKRALEGFQPEPSPAPLPAPGKATEEMIRT